MVSAAPTAFLKNYTEATTTAFQRVTKVVLMTLYIANATLVTALDILSQIIVPYSLMKPKPILI